MTEKRGERMGKESERREEEDPGRKPRDVGWRELREIYRVVCQ